MSEEHIRKTERQRGGGKFVMQAPCTCETDQISGGRYRARTLDYDGDTEVRVAQDCGQRVEPWPVTKVDVCAGRSGSGSPGRPLTAATATAACASATAGRRSSRGRHFRARVFPGQQARLLR